MLEIVAIYAGHYIPARDYEFGCKVTKYYLNVYIFSDLFFVILRPKLSEYESYGYRDRGI